MLSPTYIGTSMKHEYMNIHAFKVNAGQNKGSLEDLLKIIEQDKLDTRIREIGFSKIRVDEVKFDRKLNVWFIDIGKFRSNHGPGKASKDTAAQGFQFKKGEEFIEEAACLYDPIKKYIVIQYNHHGARAGVIQDYFCAYDHKGGYVFDLQPKYDESIEKKFLQRTATKQVQFKIAPRLLNNNDRKAGTALGSALDIGADSDSEFIELTISAGRTKKSKLTKYIDNTIGHLRTLAKRNPDSVDQLKVRVMNLDAKTEVLDLVSHRLKYTVSNMTTGADLRFPRPERYKALLRAYSSWKHII